MNSKIKKNLLDLEYNKYLQIYTTNIVIFITLFVGLIIALISNQIDFTNFVDIIIFLSISCFLLSFNVAFMIRARNKLDQIPKEIMKLVI